MFDNPNSFLYSFLFEDGIKSVLDQTITGIREGLRPDELVQRVKLAPELATNPYLKEYYGGG